MSTKTQFNELLDTLNIKLDQVFRFKLNHTINYETKSTIYYAKFIDMDNLVDAFTGKTLNTKKDYLSDEIRFVYSDIVLPGTETVTYQMNVENSIESNEIIWNNYLKDREVTINIEDFLNNYNNTLKVYPAEYVDGQGHILTSMTTVEKTDGYNLFYDPVIKVFYTTGTGIANMTTMTTQYKLQAEATEGTLNDIKRKIYTGEIEIEPSNLNQQLRPEEESILINLQNGGYNYLCGTPNGELYAFKNKPEFATKINLNTAGDGFFKGWVSNYNLGNNIRSCGHKIAASFTPLQNKATYMGIVIPKLGDTEAFDTMRFGFIEYLQ